MTPIEIVCWIAAWVVISETVFILWHKRNCNKKHGFFDLLSSEDWVLTKFISFVLGLFFILIQLRICEWIQEDSLLKVNLNYQNLLIEFCILAGIGILFLINYFIVQTMKKPEGGKKNGK